MNNAPPSNVSLKRRFQFKSLNTKLVSAFLVLGLAPLAALGVVMDQKSSSAIVDRISNELLLLADSVGKRVDASLMERYGDVEAFAHNPHALGTQAEASKAMNFYMKAYGVYDLMVLADANGRVIAANTADKDGKRADTESLIGKSVRGEAWFEDVMSGKVPEGQSWDGDVEEDPFVALVTGGRGLSMNFSAPVFDANGRVIRVWSNRLAWDRSGMQIMDDLRKDLENTGVHAVETQIVNKQGVVLDDYDKSSILKLNLADAGLTAVREVMKSRQGFVVEEHKRRKVFQINAYAPMKGEGDYKGKGWGLLVRQDYDEATRDIRALRVFTLGLALAAAIAIVVLALLIARSIIRPVGQVLNVLLTVAKGDLTPRLKLEGRDEIAQMATGLNDTLDSLENAMGAIGQNAQALASSSDEMAAVSQQLSNNAEESTGKTVLVSAAAEQINRNIQTVAAGTEELSASVSSISQNTSDAAKVAGQAKMAMQSASNTIGQLDKSSQEIGQVVKVITTIAEQTNLLALNATIEAARAGEAGKGFAVVANEVKELAKETAKATEEISKKIEGNRQDTLAAVEAITEITHVIAKVNDISGAIASAVEQQAATTSEIGRTMEEASKGSSEIARNILDVSDAAKSTSTGSNDIKNAADELARMANQLQTLVAQFKINGGKNGKLN